MRMKKLIKFDFSVSFFAANTADSLPSPLSGGATESDATDRNGPIASIDEFDEIDQFVKPSKIHVQPLHADDLLYESKKFDPTAGKCFKYGLICLNI